jgi:hypothetical protein
MSAVSRKFPVYAALWVLGLIDRLVVRNPAGAAMYFGTQPLGERRDYLRALEDLLGNGHNAIPVNL